MKQKITEKLREQRRLACKRYYDKKKKDGFKVKFIKDEDLNKCAEKLKTWVYTKK